MARGPVEQVVSTTTLRVVTSPSPSPPQSMSSINDWLAHQSVNAQDLLDASFPSLEPSKMTTLANSSWRPEKDEAQEEHLSSSDDEEELSILLCNDTPSANAPACHQPPGRGASKGLKNAEIQYSFLGKSVSKETSLWMTAYLAKRRNELHRASSQSSQGSRAFTPLESVDGAFSGGNSGGARPGGAQPPANQNQQSKKRKRKGKKSKNNGEPSLWRQMRAKQPDYDDKAALEQPKSVIEASRDLMKEIAEGL